MRGLINTGSLKRYTGVLFALAFSFCLFSTEASGQHAGQHETLDSLTALLEETGGTDRVDLLLEISQANWYISSFEESMIHATMAWQLAEELGYDEGKADALNRIGNVHYFLRNYADVIEYYNMALEIAASIRDHRRMGIYLNNTGILYRQLDEPDSAEVYLLRALGEKEVFGDKPLISSTLNNLGVLYRDRQRYNLSLEYFVRQLDLLEEIRDIRSLASVHRQTGDIFYRQRRYNESIRHFTNSLNYARELSDNALAAQAYHFLGRSYLAAGQRDMAISNLKQSLDIALEMDIKSLQQTNYDLLYQYHKEAGAYETALDFMIRQSSLKDSLRNERSANQFEQLERIFETEKQKSNIELLQKENLIHELQIRRQGHLKLLLIIFLVILFIVMTIIASRLFLRQKTNRLLKGKIAELEETNEKLRLSANSLEQLNATKNRFFSIIAHDLKNPFSALLGFSDMMTKNFNDLTEGEIREYISIIQNSSQNLYKLLENLLKWSATQTGTIHYLPEKFDIVSLIQSEINFYRINAGNKKITITTDLPDELIINSDRLLLSSVIRNILDNAIKFTHPGGNVKVTAWQNDKEIVADFTDTGIGIPDDLQKKLFSLDHNTCRNGTMDEQGGGLGLILCKELIEKTGGRIGLESSPQKGSRFWFTLPKV